MELTATTIWAILGLGLLLVEVLTGTFTFLFFAISALIVSGIKKLFHLEQLPTEIFIFSFLSLTQLFFFRKKLLAAFLKTADISPIANRKISLTHDIEAQKQASIEYQGTIWTAVNETDLDMKAGESVLIDRIEGIKLILKNIH